VPRRALLVGLNRYDDLPDLEGCVNDARAMQELLARQYDGYRNYHCQILTSPGKHKITRKFLRAKWVELFDSFDGDVLFYFSGHGTPTKVGGYLVTEDGERGDPGLAMNDLLTLANNSEARRVVLILDCCFSGHLGNPPNLPQREAQIREGVTVLAASRATQSAAEAGGHGVFTRLLLEALNGGAADIRGRVTAASIYAYVEQALGPWDQRPVYKSNADRLSPIRRCEPSVPDDVLRKLPQMFEKPESAFRVDPSFERNEASAKPEDAERFAEIKLLRNARLLTIEAADAESRAVHLTPLGQLYWRLALQENI